MPLESLLPVPSFSEVSEGRMDNGAGGGVGAAADAMDVFAMLLFFTSASRRCDAFANVSVMLASCFPRSPFMASIFDPALWSMAVTVPLRMLGARRRMVVLWRRIFSSLGGLD
jgi:hypothetical protein